MPPLIANRLIRSTLIASSAVAAVAAIAPAASASDGGGVGASCSSSLPGCTVTAQDPGGSASGGGTATGADGSTSGSSSAGGSSAAAEKCWSVTPTAAQLAAYGSPKPPSGKGHWVIDLCQVPGAVAVVTNTLRWQADGRPALPDPAVLAAQAESKLMLVKPVVESSPAAGKAQVVQLPTWAWMPKAQWAPISATAAVPGESVTATATPDQLSFSWGDGSASTCQGPGTPYVAGTSNAAAASPTCGHTYRVTSASAPGQQFPVTATLSWHIAWAGGGQAGTFPDLATATTVHWTVEQVESVLVGGGNGT